MSIFNELIVYVTLYVYIHYMYDILYSNSIFLKILTKLFNEFLQEYYKFYIDTIPAHRSRIATFLCRFHRNKDSDILA